MIKGMLAEMATGEGKTLTATLVAGHRGAGRRFPVHVVTVNDYLAQRDAELMGPLYARLGLSVGIVIAGQSAEERRAAYACDITYCTNKELAFDYLRDRMVLGQARRRPALKLEALYEPTPRARQLRLRGLHFAIVDEADSVLIDEARTPLIISGHGRIGNRCRRDRARARSREPRSRPGTDYFLSLEERRVFLTAHGQAQVATFAERPRAAWRSVITREELARQALAALHLFRQRRAICRRRGQGADRRRIYRPRHAGPVLERRPASDDRAQGRLRACRRGAPPSRASPISASSAAIGGLPG